jgi:hypothetical protein
LGPDDDFDRIERLTRRVVRGALVGVPTWVVLLAVLPFTGLGVGPCLALATGLAIAAVIAADRLRGRDRPPAAPARGAGPRRSLSPLAAAALTLLAVAIIAYVVFVISSA